MRKVEKTAIQSDTSDSDTADEDKLQDDYYFKASNTSGSYFAKMLPEDDQLIFLKNTNTNNWQCQAMIENVCDSSLIAFYLDSSSDISSWNITPKCGFIPAGMTQIIRLEVHENDKDQIIDKLLFFKSVPLHDTTFLYENINDYMYYCWKRENIQILFTLTVMYTHQEPDIDRTTTFEIEPILMERPKTAMKMDEESDQELPDDEAGVKPAMQSRVTHQPPPRYGAPPPGAQYRPPPGTQYPGAQYRGPPGQYPRGPPPGQYPPRGPAGQYAPLPGMYPQRAPYPPTAGQNMNIFAPGVERPAFSATSGGGSGYVGPQAHTSAAQAPSGESSGYAKKLDLDMPPSGDNMTPGPAEGGAKEEGRGRSVAQEENLSVSNFPDEEDDDEANVDDKSDQKLLVNKP